MPMDSYGPTSGNEERPARHLMERVFAFSIEDEVSRLRSETEWREGDRNSVTLAKEIDFRVLLSVLRDGATLHDDDGDARASIQVIGGRATLEVGSDHAELSAGQLAVVNAGSRWRLRSDGETAVLVTIAWPREKAGI